MTKNEYLDKYGIEAYERKLESNRKCQERNPKRHNVASKAWRERQRKLGYTKFCTEGYELIENYSLALKDEFDPKLWELHHKDENLHSQKWLIANNQYYNLTADKLIWLPADEHRYDSGLATNHPERSKWHQRSLEK